MNVNVIPTTPGGYQAENGVERVVNVTLSERNLKHLLGALEFFEGPLGGSHEPFLQRRCEDGTFLTVTAQTDSEHYERREPGPGFEGIV